MSKYLVWCFNDIKTENKYSTEKEANEAYENAIKSRHYSSAILRKEEKTHGYAIKSWSKENGEWFLH